jgi:hypothetical protein
MRHELGLLFLAAGLGLTPWLEPSAEDVPRVSTGPDRAAAPVCIAEDEVSDLAFREFFEQPVGPRGLAISKQLESLNGCLVRIEGFMVQRDDGAPGTFLLAPLPVQLHDQEYGPADDLPASTLVVIDPDRATAKIPFVPGRMRLAGRLSVGHREEADGRHSFVQLTLVPASQGPDLSTNGPNGS